MIFQVDIKLQNMKSLSQFASHKEVFRQPRTLPVFFQTNLVDPARVVKFFENDPQAQIRIFYYQYLKLCFELENVNYDVYISKIEDIINNPQFEFIFYPYDDQSIFNDIQAKSLIMEFFGVLGEGSISVLQALTKYPILDKIFVHFFRSYLILFNVTPSLDAYIQRDILLDFLCKEFQVDAEVHGECIRYSETDIFIYEESPTAVYMAYMDYESYNNSLEKLADEPVVSQEPSYEAFQAKTQVISSYNPPVKEIINNEPARSSKILVQLAKDSYIASQFMDFTSNVEALTAKAKIALKTSGVEQPISQPEIKKAEPVYTPPPALVASPAITRQNPPPAPPVIIRETTPVAPKPVTPVVVKESPVVIPKEAPKPAYTLPLQNFNNIAQVQSIGTTTSKQSNAKSQVVKNDYWKSAISVQAQVSSIAGQKDITTQNNIYDSANASKYAAQNQKYQRSSPPILANQPIAVKTISQPVPTQDNYFNQTSTLTSNNNSKQTNKNDIFYSPKNENNIFNVGAFSGPKAQQIKDIKSTTNYGAPSKKKTFGLNISEQHTSNQVSKVMPEPYRSNVETIKTRARNFRSSLANYIK